MFSLEIIFFTAIMIRLFSSEFIANFQVVHLKECFKKKKISS